MSYLGSVFHRPIVDSLGPFIRGKIRDRSYFMRWGGGGLVGFGGGSPPKKWLKRGGHPKKNGGKGGGGVTRNILVHAELT